MFKIILGGILAGIALFIMPFILIRVVIFFLLIGLIFRLFGGRRWHWQHRHAFYGIDPQKKHVYAQRWRNMNEEERKSFIQKMEAEFMNRPSSENQ